MSKLFAVFLLTTCMVFPQSYLLQKQFGQFSDATSFALSPQGYFYVADNGSDEIYKLDSMGTQIVAQGGYGWGNNQFDYPIDVSLNALNIFITDKNNHSVQEYDKDLNFISRLYKRDSQNSDETFGFPLSADISTMGDLFILDSENIRVLKFDLFGNFILNFGGYDAGDFVIKNPKKLIVTEENYVMILDGSSLLVFDQFGNGLSAAPLPGEFTSIDKYYKTITLTSDHTIFVSSYETNKLAFKKLPLPENSTSESFNSSMVVGDKVYALTPSTILCFQKVDE